MQATVLWRTTSFVCLIIFPLIGGYLGAQERGKEWTNGHRYLLVKTSERISWEEARRRCESEGGHLATGESEEELDFIMSLIRYEVLTDQNCFLGAVANYDERDWRWISGVPANDALQESARACYKYDSSVTDNQPRVLAWLTESERLKADGRDEPGFGGPAVTQNFAKAFVIEWNPDAESFTDFDVEKFAKYYSGEMTSSETKEDPQVILPVSDAVSSIALERRLAQVTGLLISSLSENRNAGSSSVISVSALPTSSQDGAPMKFNQPVGESMRRALGEVAKHIVLTHNGWPVGTNIEFSFAEKYVPKDGPSAAVACALLLESLITGVEINPSFALTGDMNADGTVQPIGGCAAKLRGATKGGAEIVMFPHDNEPRLRDLIVEEGLHPFVKVQVLTAKNFTDAKEAALTPTPEVVLAYDNFQKIQDLYKRDPRKFGLYLKNEIVLQTLKDTTKAMPNHLSAQYLLMAARGRTPTQLSLLGSLRRIDDSADQLLRAVKDKKDHEFPNLQTDYLADMLSSLRASRATLDPRTRKYADSIVDFGIIVGELRQNPPTTRTSSNRWQSRIENGAARISTEWDNLRLDEETMEELQ